MIALVLMLAIAQASVPSGNQSPNAPVDVGRIDIGVTAAAPVGTAIVSGDVLQRLDRRDLGQAVELLPGMTLRRLGPRNETGLFLRGFDLRQVPLFVDGFPVYVAYDGHLDLSRLLANDVAEIRVSHGIASVLYGPNALGGAVNIVSRQPTRGVEGQLSAHGGRAGDYSLNAQVASRRGAWAGTLSAARLWADAYVLPDGSERTNAYRRDAHLSARAAYTKPVWSAMIGASIGRGEKGSPPYIGADPAVRVRYWQWPRWDKDDYWTVATVQLGKAGFVRGRVWRDTFDNAQYMYDDATYTTQRLPSSTRTIFDDHSDGGSLEWGAPLPRGVAVRTVAHIKADHHTEFNEGEPHRHVEDRIYSGGAEVTWSARRLTLLAAVSGDHLDARYADDYQQGRLTQFVVRDTGGVNPQFSAAIALAESSRVYVVLSHKTRLPTMNDRYSYRQGMAIPNPDLGAEHGLTTEVGYEVKLARRLTLTVAGYRTGIDNLIQRVVVRPNVIQFQNVGRVTHAGFDVSAAWRPLATLQTDATYGYLHRRNEVDPAVLLLDTPRHHVAVTPTWMPMPAVTLSALLSADSSRPSQTNSGRAVVLPAFARVDLKGSWRFAHGLSAEVSLFNAGNKHIAYMEGYPEAGRSWLVGTRWVF